MKNKTKLTCIARHHYCHNTLIFGPGGSLIMVVSDHNISLLSENVKLKVVTVSFVVKKYLSPIKHQ